MPRFFSILLFVSSIFAFYVYENTSISTSIMIPFTGRMFQLGVFYVPFIIFYYVSTTNPENLTDGLDGMKLK